jgi:2-oxoglutarate ferredoxin oxidoreductase subunit beta
MSSTFIDTKNLPFCKGCSHASIARNTEKALEKCGLDPLDVVLVTDIGCHGIIDKKFKTHTVHGLHGRSVALAGGISAALTEPGKKIIVFIGDGGATIGINHLVSAAHRNFDMTVVVHNNMLYGMTGGQQSDLTPGEFCTPTSMNGYTEDNLDLTKLITAAGAAYVSRIEARGDFSDELAEAINHRGFSLVEALEICPSYGTKSNADLKLAGISEKYGISLEKNINEDARQVKITENVAPKSLLDSLSAIEKSAEHALKDEITIILGGSAGGGVQTAATILANAALACGLNVAKRGLYPVTVGVGFSVSEIKLSPKEIEYVGIRKIDAALIATPEGLEYLRPRLEKMEAGTILLDGELQFQHAPPRILQGDFSGAIHHREMSLALIYAFLKKEQIFSAELFVQALKDSRLGKRIDVDKLIATVDGIAI